jgi:hypothetical protein
VASWRSLAQTYCDTHEWKIAFINKNRLGARKGIMQKKNESSKKKNNQEIAVKREISN